MKKLWILPVLLLAASVLIFTGCKSDDDSESSTTATEPKEITDFQFATYGSASGKLFLSNSNKTVTVTDSGSDGYGFSYTLPADYASYSKVEFTYATTVTTKNAKFTLKKTDGWTDTDPKSYPDFTTGTTKEFNLNLFGGNKIFFQFNLDEGNANAGAEFEIAFSKITLKP